MHRQIKTVENILRDNLNHTWDDCSVEPQDDCPLCESLAALQEIRRTLVLAGLAGDAAETVQVET